MTGYSTEGDSLQSC